MNEAPQAILDVDRQKQARQYARISRRMMLIDLTINSVYILAWLLTGVSSWLRTTISQLTPLPFFQVALFALAFGGFSILIDLPISYYFGYILTHRFGQSNETLKGWITDQVKGLALSAVLGLLLLESIYWILRTLPDTWWLWAGVFLFVVNVLLANLAPVLIAPIFYKFEPLDETHPDLVARLLELAKRSKTRVQGVYKFDMSKRTKGANAAVFGLWNTRRIILGDTLINEFSPDEIETVMAHELGHQVHKDIAWGLAISTLITLFGLFIAAVGMFYGIRAFGLSGPGDPAGMPLLALIIGLFGIVTTPLSNAYSRWRERLADRYTLETTQNGTAYASALVRLANQNLAEIDPEPWVEMLLFSHPALSKRIRMAQAYPKS